MTYEELPEALYGWWRITDTSQWGNQDIDVIGPALICVEGPQDRLRMFWLIADLELMPTKTGPLHLGGHVGVGFDDRHGEDEAG